MTMIGVLIQIRDRAIVLSGVEHDKVEEFAKRERERQMRRLSSTAVGVVVDFMVVSNYAHVRIYGTFRHTNTTLRESMATVDEKRVSPDQCGMWVSSCGSRRV
jgi:hypothetical protein